MTAFTRSDDPRTGAAPFAWAGVVAMLVLLTRLPFLGHGYGVDPDAWRAMLSAQFLLDTGRYIPSRPPGYPVPEYVDAFMLWVGLGSSWWIGLLNSLMAGLCAFWLVMLASPLGRGRFVPLALAFAFTPVVFVASLGAMDYLWGAAFFLCATWFALQGRVWNAAVWLGLAAASRPTYALGFLPLAHILLDLQLGRLRTAWAWRRILTLAVVSGGITLALFVPAILEIGMRVLGVPAAGSASLMQRVFNPTIGLFGLIGVPAVATVACLAIWAPQASSEGLLCERQRRLRAWAWWLVIIYALLFLRLPDESAYLLPAVMGGYLLLAMRTSARVLWGLTIAMAISTMVGSLARKPEGGVTLRLAGPVPREQALQDRRSCIASVLRKHLASRPATEYVVTADYRPQLLWALRDRHAPQLLYTVDRNKDDGALRDSEGVAFADATTLWVLDRVIATQNEQWEAPAGLLRVLDTRSDCPDSAF